LLRGLAKLFGRPDRVARSLQRLGRFGRHVIFIVLGEYLARDE
jgi:hypothetical protein